jgi:hypothetical protein
VLVELLSRHSQDSTLIFLQATTRQFFSSTGKSLTTAVRSTCGLENADWNLRLGVVALRSQMSYQENTVSFQLTNFFVLLTIHIYRGDVGKFTRHQYKVNSYTEGLMTVRQLPYSGRGYRTQRHVMFGIWKQVTSREYAECAQSQRE